MMKLHILIFVKEILIDYRNHGIFEEAPTYHEIGIKIFIRPLSERVGLVVGHLYYLIPLPLPHDELINYNTNSNTWPFVGACSNHSIPRTNGLRLQPPSSSIIGKYSIRWIEAMPRLFLLPTPLTDQHCM